MNLHFCNYFAQPPLTALTREKCGVSKDAVNHTHHLISI